MLDLQLVVQALTKSHVKSIYSTYTVYILYHAFFCGINLTEMLSKDFSLF